MQKTRRNVLIEGYSVDEILGLSNEQLDSFVFCAEPIVFAGFVAYAERRAGVQLSDNERLSVESSAC